MHFEQINSALLTKPLTDFHKLSDLQLAAIASRHAITSTRELAKQELQGRRVSRGIEKLSPAIVSAQRVLDRSADDTTCQISKDDLKALILLAKFTVIGRGRRSW